MDLNFVVASMLFLPKNGLGCVSNVYESGVIGVTMLLGPNVNWVGCIGDCVWNVNGAVWMGCRVTTELGWYVNGAGWIWGWVGKGFDLYVYGAGRIAWFTALFAWYVYGAGRIACVTAIFCWYVYGAGRDGGWVRYTYFLVP